jgi:hypothetical protein
MLVFHRFWRNFYFYSLNHTLDAEHLFVASFKLREEFLLLQLKCNLLVGGQDRAFETPEIAKMLHNVYKGSSIGKYPLTVDRSECPRASK